MQCVESLRWCGRVWRVLSRGVVWSDNTGSVEGIVEGKFRGRILAEAEALVQTRARAGQGQWEVKDGCKMNKEEDVLCNETGMRGRRNRELSIWLSLLCFPQKSLGHLRLPGKWPNCLV